MAFVLIGILVGCSMALTGSGGALLSIPLFMKLLGFSLKTATLYSLIIVVLGSLIGLLSSYKDIFFKYALSVAAMSFLGSFVFKNFKSHIDERYITYMLYVVCLISLFSIWKKTEILKGEVIQRSAALPLIISGFILGALTTLTGLGGGVFLLPLYLKFFRLSEKNAVATSLLTMLLSAGLSYIIQMSENRVVLKVDEFLLMALGVGAGVLLIRLIMRYLSEKKLFLLSRTVYSAIVIYTLFNL